MDEISFGTDGWRATLETFTDRRVRIVGQAVASSLRDEGIEGTVAVGYDARATSRGFAEELSRVLCANGFDVLLPGRDCPTPVVAYGVVNHGLAGACMVTASHNPPEYNGVKFIPADGAPAAPAVTDAVEARLGEPSPPADDRGTVERVDLVASHAAAARSLVGGDPSGARIVYDAMYGSGRGVTDRLLADTGAEVLRLRCDRDPEFGGGAPEPSADRLEPLAAQVRERDADLGVANDGDADRIAVCTPDRGVLDENLLFAALYDYLLEDDAGPAVRTVSTTFLIDEIAAAHGETVVETPVGFKHVAAAMAERDALIGGEESGGFTIRGHVREKDGVLLALLAAVADRAEPLDDRVDRLLAEHGAINADKASVDCPDDRKPAVMDAFRERAPDAVAGEPVADAVTVDGVKLLLADGSWLLVRPSGTEPVIRVYAEAADPGRVDELLEAGRELVAPLVSAAG